MKRERSGNLGDETNEFGEVRESRHRRASWTTSSLQGLFPPSALLVEQRSAAKLAVMHHGLPSHSGLSVKQSSDAEFSVVIHGLSPLSALLVEQISAAGEPTGMYHGLSPHSALLVEQRSAVEFTVVYMCVSWTVSSLCFVSRAELVRPQICIMDCLLTVLLVEQRSAAELAVMHHRLLCWLNRNLLLSWRSALVLSMFVSLFPTLLCSSTYVLHFFPFPQCYSITSE